MQSLEHFVESVNGTSHLRIEHDFGGGFVRLQTSEAERRQAAQDIQCSEDIVLELLRNSRDAHATHIFIAMAKEGEQRHLTVIDDGDGIPEEMHERVFEPRVTSKLDTSHMDAWGLHGRGMALYSVSVNANEARVMQSESRKGCAIKVETDVSVLGEKKDQSSFPTFSMSDEKTVSVRGPRNILRTTCEFAIDSRAQCSVYIGSPAEVCSTIYYYGLATLSSIDRLFCKDVASLPLIKRLATARTPKDLAELAEGMGMSLSERTARRIMDGQVSVLSPILDDIVIESQPNDAHPRIRQRKKTRPYALTQDDKELLASGVMDAYAEISRRYYLEAGVEPSIQAKADRITITIPVVKRP